MKDRLIRTLRLMGGALRMLDAPMRFSWDGIRMARERAIGCRFGGMIWKSLSRDGMRTEKGSKI